MIIEAKYTGPMARIIVPGTAKKVAQRGEVVKIALSGCIVLGGCWEITKGQKEYDAHVAEIEAEKAARIKAKEARRKAAAESVEEKVGERSAKKTTTDKGKKE